MPTPRKMTGKASYINYKGTKLWITKVAPKFDPKLADSTDSADYDPTTQLLYPSQLQVSVGTELSIEGYYDANGNQNALMTDLFNGSAGPQSVTLGRDAGSIVGSGNFNISGYEEEEPIDDMITYKCTLKSNGKFTPGS
jgi:hypothetical protein